MKHTHTHTQKTRKLSIVMIGMIITMIIIGFGLWKKQESKGAASFWTGVEWKQLICWG